MVNDTRPRPRLDAQGGADPRPDRGRRGAAGLRARRRWHHPGRRQGGGRGERLAALPLLLRQGGAGSGGHRLPSGCHRREPAASRYWQRRRARGLARHGHRPGQEHRGQGRVPSGIHSAVSSPRPIPRPAPSSLPDSSAGQPRSATGCGPFTLPGASRPASTPTTWPSPSSPRSREDFSSPRFSGTPVPSKPPSTHCSPSPGSPSPAVDEPPAGPTPWCGRRRAGPVRMPGTITSPARPGCSAGRPVVTTRHSSMATGPTARSPAPSRCLRACAWPHAAFAARIGDPAAAYQAQQPARYPGLDCVDHGRDWAKGGDTQGCRRPCGGVDRDSSPGNS